MIYKEPGQNFSRASPPGENGSALQKKTIMKRVCCYYTERKLCKSHHTFMAEESGHFGKEDCDEP